MRIAEIVFSIIIAAAVVFLIYKKERPAPELLTSTQNGYTIELTTVPTASESTTVVIPVKITGPKSDNFKYLFRYAKPDIRIYSQLHRYGTIIMEPIDSAMGTYKGIFNTGAKGSLSYYYVEILDPVGSLLNNLKKSEHQALTTLVIGKVDSWVYYGRYLTILVSIFFVTLGSLASIKILSERENVRSGRVSFLWGSLSLVAGAFVLTLWYRIQLTAGSWHGAPFGADFGDNLVEFLLVFLLFLVVISTEITTRAGMRSTISPRAILGYAGVGAFFLMLAAFLLPLLIEPSFPQTDIIFYAFLALLIVTFLLMYRRTKNA